MRPPPSETSAEEVADPGNPRRKLFLDLFPTVNDPSVLVYGRPPKLPTALLLRQDRKANHTQGPATRRRRLRISFRSLIR